MFNLNIIIINDHHPNPSGSETQKIFSLLTCHINNKDPIFIQLSLYVHHREEGNGCSKSHMMKQRYWEQKHQQITPNHKSQGQQHLSKEYKSLNCLTYLYLPNICP